MHGRKFLILTNCPVNLIVGIRKDGNSVHFFHRSKNPYTKGQQKRRKIGNGSTSLDLARWKKTGKTMVIFKNRVQLGFKKIMVLYENGYRGSKTFKANWVMHQYHLGTDKVEKEGEYVVSKVFYRIQNQVQSVDESDEWMRLNSPPNEEDPFCSQQNQITSNTSNGFQYLNRDSGSGSIEPQVVAARPLDYGCYMALLASDPMNYDVLQQNVQNSYHVPKTQLNVQTDSNHYTVDVPHDDAADHHIGNYNVNIWPPMMQINGSWMTFLLILKT